MYIVLLTLVFSVNAVFAQTVLRGVVDYPYLGIRLTIPDQWKGQEEGDYLILASDTEPGLIGLTLNDASSVDQLKQVADQGWHEEGISMKRSGDFRRIGAEGMGAEFTGLFQGTRAKAFIAGIINPFGKGVTIISLTSETAYGEKEVTRLMSIADTLKFALPHEAPDNANWRETLPGKVLTAMDSSYTSGTPYFDEHGQSYGSYSSYSSRHTINVCPDGRFHTSSSSSASFDSTGGFGHVQSGDSNSGLWQLTSSSTGESILQLNFENGSVVEHTLDKREGKTYLNGSRYYRTVSDSC